MLLLWIFGALVVLFVLLPIIGAAVSWVIWTAIVGIFLGGLARLIIPGKQNISVIATIVCGWIGALIGGAIGDGVWGWHHHRFATLLIEIGISTIAVLGWTATHRKPVAVGVGHKIIDI